MHIKLHVWRATYSHIFESSSAGQKYTNRYLPTSGVFLTAGDSISDLQSAISSKLGGQCTVTGVSDVEYLGPSGNYIDVREE